MKKPYTIAVFLLLANACLGQKITFSGQVASIIYNNCTSCHRAGAIAPFALESYEDVYNNRFAIKNAVETKIMPPWSPNSSYSHFSGERTLNAAQIGQINAWILNGAERGDISKEPQVPVFNDNAQLPNPDFSTKTPEHTVTQDLDDFQTFALPSGLTSDKWIKQIELVPGNTKIVHHIFVFIDSTGNFKDFMNSNAFSNNNISNGNYISGGPKDMLKLIGGWLPGGSYFSIPSNMGFHIPANSNYIVQIHYAPGSNGQSDATQLNVKYSTDNNLRGMDMKPLLNNIENLTDGPLIIPANTVRMFHEKFTVTDDMALISITPHMHKIGKRLKVYAVNYCGHDTIPLIDDKWDFHWQGMYTFLRPIHLKPGDIIYAEGTFVNTSQNPDNPNNPPKEIVAGTSTLTEMMQVFFCWMPYQKGDENIVLGTTPLPPMDYATSCALYPNPGISGGEINIVLDPIEPFRSMSLYTINGKQIMTYEPGYITNTANVKIPDLPNGVYIIEVSNASTVIRKKFVVYNAQR
jgi:hypothetical protein